MGLCEDWKMHRFHISFCKKHIIPFLFENADNKKQAVSLVDSLYKERIKTLKVIL